jgi:SAM-dependent methyltransferase
MNDLRVSADPNKQQVHDFWQQASCGEALYLDGTEQESYRRQAERRYQLEPYIADLARFESTAGQEVLEIGVGLGADHQRFAECGARLTGVDLTNRAVEHTQRRLGAFGLASRLSTGDAEALAFPDGSFDVVYSWGVLHHSPNTPQALREVLRVLKPGGEARIMIYHTWSIVGFMLWVRYGLLALKPWRTLGSIYAEHLESPGTKAYSMAEAQQLLAGFEDISIRTQLTHGDLLESGAGQRHRGALLAAARAMWPRSLIRRALPQYGLFMLIRARKPACRTSAAAVASGR